MNYENSILTKVAITMAPRLNNALFSPLFQQCGGISGFFEETDQNIEALFRENNRYRILNIPAQFFAYADKLFL